MEPAFWGKEMAVNRSLERSWTRLSWWVDRVEKRLPGPARRVVTRARRDDILLLSGALGFYALVSLVPLVILALWMTGLMVSEDRIHELADRLTQMAPAHIGIGSAVQGAAEEGTRFGVVAALLALWPATAYGSGLAQAFERITPRPDRQRSGVRGRGIAVVVLLPLFVLGSILASFMGTKLLEDARAGAVLGPVVALGTAFAIAAVAIAVIYKIFPSETLKWDAVLKATTFTSAGVSLLSLVFVLYVSLGADFEQRYASSWMGMVILIAVWLYVANVLLLVGYKIALEADSTSGAKPPSE
jgi:membrane protein